MTKMQSNSYSLCLCVSVVNLSVELERLVVAQPHEDLVAFDFHFMRPGRLGRRHREGRAGFDVELRPVPRTGDRARFADRAALRSAARRRACRCRPARTNARPRESARPAARRPRPAACPGSGISDSLRDCDKISHVSLAPKFRQPDSAKQQQLTPTTSSGKPRFSDFALVRRSSIRPETTTRIPPAENHKPRHDQQQPDEPQHVGEAFPCASRRRPIP